jgi:ubiquinol-cytochrome c reductase cytochrome b subunit
MIRRIHGTGGSFLLILLFLHLAKIFYGGDYKVQRPAAWVAGVLSLAVAVWVNFTGFFLPLSQHSFWGTATVLSHLSFIPYGGSFFADFIRGGKELGGAALTRFYSMHIGFAALLFILLRCDPGGEWDGERAGEKDRRRQQGLWTAWFTAALLLGAITFVPESFSDPLREAVDPLSNPGGIFLPWYFLFWEETLKFFTRAYPMLSPVLILSFVVFILFLPYIDRNPERRIFLRPVSFGLGIAVLVAWVYFSFVGMANARYGEKIVLPDRNLLVSEMRGARVYLEKNCAYCHQIFGRGGRREGPDLSGVQLRNRSPEWIQRFVLNPRIYQPGTTMPGYEIRLEDLEALAAYLLSFDPQKQIFRTVERRRFLDLGLNH